MDVLTRSWWALLLRGIAAVVFGILAFIWPSVTLTVLVLFFGAYVLVDGVFAIIAAVSNAGASKRWWILLVEGIVGVVVGLLIFAWPVMTTFLLLYFIAAWAVVTGVLEITAAIQLRRVISNEWILVLSGILSILFGVVLVLMPSAGALAVVWIIAIYALLFGALLLSLAIRLRNWGRGARRAV